MPPEIFISYASADKVAADAVCALLEQRGLRCWMAPRDVKPGARYGAEIVQAIASAFVLVVILTHGSNQSRHVAKEVERAVSRGLIVIPFRLEEIVLNQELEYFLSSDHWLDAITPPLESHIKKLGDTIVEILPGRRRMVSPAFSAAERSAAIKQMEEVAPDEWRHSPSGPVGRFLRNLFTEK